MKSKERLERWTAQRVHPFPYKKILSVSITNWERTNGSNSSIAFDVTPQRLSE